MGYCSFVGRILSGGRGGGGGNKLCCVQKLGCVCK